MRKEKTCTYRAHIGHYKAAMRDPCLSWLFFQRSEIPELSGYSPKRHQQGIDLMLLKKSQNYNIGKQSIIGILESKFNHSNRDLGREAMTKALKCNAIAVEQFSRPGRSAIDQSTLKRITMDHQLYKRQCFSQASVDLQSNYDRVIHTAAALALLRIGVNHKKYIQCLKQFRKWSTESEQHMVIQRGPMEEKILMDGKTIHRVWYREMPAPLQSGLF